MRVALATVGLAVAVAGAAGGWSAQADGFAVKERADVVDVPDGDSVYVRGSNVPIRMIGLDAPEKGDCFYAKSRSQLRRLVAGRAVVLKAASRSSTSRNDRIARPLRHVELRGRDITEAMLAGGWALPNSAASEHSRELRYSHVAQGAAARGLRMWQPDLCGPGPAADLRVMVNYDADGSDKTNTAGKYIRVVNDGSAVDLRGWRLRLENRKYFPIPPVTLQQGDSLVVHNGRQPAWREEVNGITEHHFSYGRTITLANPENSRFPTGAVFLSDPRGNYRVWAMWPCSVACRTWQLQGRLELAVRGSGTETAVAVRNTGTAPVDASYLVLKAAASVEELPPGTVVPPGGNVLVHADPRPGELGFSRYPGNLTRQQVVLRGHDGVVVDRLR